jgi:hypothetical protein
MIELEGLYVLRQVGAVLRGACGAAKEHIRPGADAYRAASSAANPTCLGKLGQFQDRLSGAEAVAGLKNRSRIASGTFVESLGAGKLRKWRAESFRAAIRSLNRGRALVVARRATDDGSSQRSGSSY